MTFVTILCMLLLRRAGGGPGTIAKKSCAAGGIRSRASVLCTPFTLHVQRRIICAYHDANKKVGRCSALDKIESSIKGCICEIYRRTVTTTLCALVRRPNRNHHIPNQNCARTGQQTMPKWRAAFALGCATTAKQRGDCPVAADT